MSKTSRLSEIEYEQGREIVGPDEAKKYLEEHNFERNRDYIPTLAMRYAEEMKTGEFAAGTRLTLVVDADGRITLTDGQHRLRAVILADEVVDFSTITYITKDEKEMLQLYSVLDVGNIRKLADSIKAHGLAADIELTARQAHQLAVAGRLISIGPAEGQRHRMVNRKYADDIARAREWAGEGQAYFAAIKDCPRYILSIMNRTPVVAAALITMRSQMDTAIEFWYEVAHVENSHNKDPRRALHNSFVDAFINKDGSRLAINNTTWDIIRFIATAWNAHCRGENVQVLRRLKMLKFTGCKLPWEEKNDKA